MCNVLVVNVIRSNNIGQLLTQHFISSTLVTILNDQNAHVFDPNTSTSSYLTTTIKARNFGHVSESYEKMPSELYPAHTLSFKMFLSKIVWNPIEIYSKPIQYWNSFERAIVEMGHLCNLTPQYIDCFKIGKMGTSFIWSQFSIRNEWWINRTPRHNYKI